MNMNILTCVPATTQFIPNSMKAFSKSLRLIQRMRRMDIISEEKKKQIQLIRILILQHEN